MNLKFKSIITISIIFLSVLNIGWDFKLGAINQYEENTHTSTSRSNNHSRAGDFDWGEIEIISEPIISGNININESTHPKIAIENDKIYVVWIDKTDYKGAGGDYDIFYRYFDGSTWSNIQVISEPVSGQSFNTGHSYIPDIDVKNGKIYVTWCDNTSINGAGTDWDIFYRCNLSGTGWEDIQVISEPVPGYNFNTGNSAFPSIAVENGKISVVWHDTNNTISAATDYDIFYRCNLTGTGWEDIQVISEPVSSQNFNTGHSQNPRIAVENNKIFVVWHDGNNTNGAMEDSDIFFRCNLIGSGWEDIQVISEPVSGQDFNTGNSNLPKIAVENSKIYVIWFDINNTNGAGSGDSDIFYRCNLSGNGWENIQVISEPVSGKNLNTGASYAPEIAVENGKIYVFWYDNNNTDGSGPDGDIFYRCNITCVNWEDIKVTSEPVPGKNFNTEGSDHPDIAVNLGKIYIVWVDNNNTNGAGTDWDIFYRYIYSPLVLNFPSVIPPSGNTSTDFNFTVTYTHLINIAPTEITVNISGIEYLMLEVNPDDTNYLDNKDYFFNIKNLDIGVHTYQFYTSDGKFTWSTKLINKPIVYNSAPIIITEDNLTAVEDIYYEVNYEYEDIDITNVGQPGYWNFSTNANWLNFNYTTAILNGTPNNDDVGEYWINISINDGIELDFTNFTLTVTNVNDAPILITNNIGIANEDEVYEVVYEAIDIDTPQDNLIWTMSTNASWLKFKPLTAKLNGIPPNDDVGKYWVNITVSDNEYSDHSNFTLTVKNVNDPPRIISKDNTTAFEDEFYEVIYKAEDVDNTQGDLTWIINTNAKWLNHDISIAIINGTPTNDDIGEYWVNLSVSDNEFIDFTNFTLTVLNTNDAPMIINEDKTNVTLGELYSVNYEAEDIDPPPITLTWSIKTNSSDWLSIGPMTGLLIGIPLENNVGIYWVNISVTDGENGWDYHNFTLKVLQLPIQKNNAPKLFNVSMTPSKGDIDIEFTFSIHYFDADGDAPVPIQVIIDDIPRNMKIKSGDNVSNGTYEYSIYLTQGTHIYYFTASDGLEKISTDNYTTPEIKKLEEISKEKTSWYWLIWIVIFVIIITLILFGYIYNKRKAVKIPVVKAELMKAAPKHLALPGEISSDEIAESLLIQSKILDQLPPPKVQIQPTTTTQGDKTYTSPSTIPTPVQPQYQLPQATLTKAQKLGLLQERFLRDEVTEETYNKLKSEIEGNSDEDITLTEEELKEQSTISDQQLTKPIEEGTKMWISSIKTPEPVGKPPLESVIKPQFKTQQLQPEQQETTATQTEQTPQELSPNQEVDAHKQQTSQSQSSTQTQQQLKPSEKGKTIQK